MKDKKAFIIYILLTLLFWQFMESVSKIVLKGYFVKNNPVFFITQTTNNGAAFGLLEGSPYILGIVGVVVIFSVSFYVFKNVTFQEKAKILSLSVFAAGILGNTVERLLNGYVVDFIKLAFVDFPVFNMYDVLICASVFCYVFLSLREELFKKGLKIGNSNKK